ncbi:MAG: anion permease, partial [Alphaproteobacteria bacterium]|nr:anion permease [Alphaproteobacteria bacterium]
SASCAFMLPVATAPNAIVVGGGHVRSGDLAREGLVLNLLGAVVITVLTVLLVH